MLANLHLAFRAVFPSLDLWQCSNSGLWNTSSNARSCGSALNSGDESATSDAPVTGSPVESVASLAGQKVDSEFAIAEAIKNTAEAAREQWAVSFVRDLPSTEILAIDTISAPASSEWLDLQLFAAEDEGRTEEPSERRKREEREKGNVPKSQDMAGSAILIGGVLMLFLFGTYMVQRIGEMFSRYFGLIATQQGVFGIEELQVLMKDLFYQTGMILLPILLVTIVMGVIGNVVQVGLMFSLQTLQFRFERMKPDFKRVLPVRRNLFNLLKVIMQMLIIAGAAYLVIIDDFIPMLKASGMGLTQAVTIFATVALKLLLLCGVLLLIISIPDFFYQRFEYIENLKVTTAEAKRERKDEEGDPLLKQRQRERAYEMRRQKNMLGEVPQADVVITNPTHYAVALKYDQLESTAPMVIAKGTDQLAFSIRKVAQEYSIPVEENPLLARTLYRDVEIGQEIPESLYRAVSVIFSRLTKFRQRAGA